MLDGASCSSRCTRNADAVNKKISRIASPALDFRIVFIEVFRTRIEGSPQLRQIIQDAAIFNNGTAAAR